MTDIDVYQPAAGIGQYQAGIVMTPESAKALDDQVRACTQAVLREGVDYGHIPGTNGDEKSLWRPGAQKLLQWFQLGCTCDRVEVERDDDGRKHGITYRAVVTKRLPDGTRETLATCEGTADYDESKFWQSAEEVQRKAEYNERKWAKQYGRVADPTKWKDRGEYRADWNALMKRAQKRAIVGATVDATAAGGIFTDREEDDSAPAPQDDGPTWYEQALEAALTFTTREDGNQIFLEAAAAARDGRCTPRQANHVQNRIRQRGELLKTATPVDVEDLGRAETPAAEDDTRSQPRTEPRNGAQRRTAGERTAREARPRAAGAAPSRGAQPPPPQDPESSSSVGATEPHSNGPAASVEAPEDEPGSASEDQLTSLHIILGGLGFTTADREQKLKIAETITGRAPLTGPRADGRSTKNLSFTEARKLADTLEGFGGDREKLIEYMAGREQAGDSDA
jgi:hypothetical protein